jgi:hypothetical protein
MKFGPFIYCGAFLAFAPSAFACIATPVRYHFKNETVQSSLSANAGERCILKRKPSPGARFNASAIILQPRNGKAQIYNAHSILYTPNTGFKGNDRFIQRVCGDGGTLQSSSCSNIEYMVTVEKRTAAGSYRSAVLECWKQHGARWDPNLQKWMTYPSPQLSMVLADAIRACISRRTGIPRNQIPIPEIPIN